MNVEAVGGSTFAGLNPPGPADNCLGVAEPSMQGLEVPGLCKEHAEVVCCLSTGVMALSLLALTWMLLKRPLLAAFPLGEATADWPMVQRSSCCARLGLLPILARLLLWEDRRVMELLRRCRASLSEAKMHESELLPVAEEGSAGHGVDAAVQLQRVVRARLR